MNNVEALGAVSLGVVIGWLVSYFVRRFKKFNPQILASTIPIFIGGGVIKFLQDNSSAIWFYPIGLLIGFSLNVLFAWLDGNEDVFTIDIDEDDTEDGNG